jgi:hypothetical protein
MGKEYKITKSAKKHLASVLKRNKEVLKRLATM